MTAQLSSGARAVDPLAFLDSLHVTDADGAITNRKWPEAQDARAAVAELVAAVAAVYGEPCYDEDNAGDDPCAPDCMSCRIRAALAPFSEAGR